MNKITINVDSPKKSINPMIYGNFIEHLAECIHNGVWTYDPVNVPLIQNNPLLVGVREDVLQATKAIQPTVLRAFGGCYSDVYHWKDAIGPRDSRKKVKNKYWGTGYRRILKGLGPKIDNQFGTDEFLAFCEEINAIPYISVNYGTGTPQEAADWVEYCNSSPDTKYGALRAENGRKEPYNVPIWGIANEIYGFWEKGYERKPENYAKKYMIFAQKMREKDPSIKLVACGCEFKNWNVKLLQNIDEDYLDYLSIHKYFPHPILRASTYLKKMPPRSQEVYYSLLASPLKLEKFINDTWNDITSVYGKETSVRITVDEWGLWYRMRFRKDINFMIQDGLFTALVLMLYQKYSEIAPMNLWAMLVNVFGMIRTDKDGIILTPPYSTFDLFRRYSGNKIIEDINIKCDTFNSKKFGMSPKALNVPLISCNGTLNEQGDILSIFIVNKHFSDGCKIHVELTNFIPNETATIALLTSKSPFDMNTKENRTKIQIVEKEITNIRTSFELEFNPRSLTILRLSKK